MRGGVRLLGDDFLSRSDELGHFRLKVRGIAFGWLRVPDGLVKIQRLLDLFIGRGARDAENFVIIFELNRHFRTGS